MKQVTKRGSGSFVPSKWALGMLVAGLALGGAAAGCGDEEGSVLGDGGAGASVDGTGGTPMQRPSTPDDECPNASDVLCDGVCTATAANPAHCGDCGKACGDLVCSDGSCVDECASGQSECAGGCVDLTTDVRHCGECGKTCQAGQTCEASVCVGEGAGGGLLGDGKLPEGTWTPKEEQVSEVASEVYDLAVYEGEAYVAVPLPSGDTQVFRYDGGWQSWGAPLAPASGNEVDSAALRFNSSGVATLATVQHPLGKPHVLHYVHFFEDGAWKGYGGQAKRTGALFPQSFDLEVRGNEVFLLYTTHPGDTSTHAPTVQHWNGNAWKTLVTPSVPDSLQRSFGSDIAIDSEGELFLAWTENVGEPATPDKVLLVMRFDDGAWTQVGDTLFSLSQPRLAFASDDTLVLAGIREGKAEVRMLTTTWVQLGKPLTTNDAKSDVRSPSLALTPGDTPVLAFRESIDKMPVVSVNGLVKEWVLLGELIEPTSGYEDVKYPRIASDGSSLWVTWIEAEKFSNVGGFIRAARLE